MIEKFREIDLEDEAARRDTIEEHSQVMYALVVRDIPNAIDALVRHIEKSKIRVLTAVLQQRRNQATATEE